MQIIFAKGREESNRASDSPLVINNCGYYQNIVQPMMISRIHGRADYHIIFVASGEISSNHGEIRQGECLYYKPGDAQIYNYEVKAQSAYFWVHYSGAEAESLLGGRQSGVIKCGEGAGQVHELLLKMTHAIHEQMVNADRYAEGIFRAVCALIDGGGKAADNRFKRAIALMGDFTQSYEVIDYARAMGMSEGHFIRSFKQAMGMTPVQYRLKMQVDYARNLLLETMLSLTRVAEMAGFNDNAYFTKVFRAQVGITPAEYQKFMGKAWVRGGKITNYKFL